MTSPAEKLTPVVDNSGFTLVEEDDVAFSISLCREIHRIYGSYQSGELEADHSVHLGLSLTVQMLANLASAVTKGMPAMRIEVATAQTREMMAVMFGTAIAGAQHLGDGRDPLGHGRGLLGEQRRPEEITVGSSPGPAVSAIHLESPPVPDVRSTRSPLSNRFGRWFGARPLMLRILLGILACGLAAAMVDAPIVILLLFPNLFTPLSISYAAIAFAAWCAHKRRIIRARDRDGRVLSSNPLSWSVWNGKASPTCAVR